MELINCGINIGDGGCNEDGGLGIKTKEPSPVHTTSIIWLFVLVLISGAGLLVTGHRRIRK